jgi:hypothetical protein
MYGVYTHRPDENVRARARRPCHRRLFLSPAHHPTRTPPPTSPPPPTRIGRVHFCSHQEHITELLHYNIPPRYRVSALSRRVLFFIPASGGWQRNYTTI